MAQDVLERVSRAAVELERAEAAADDARAELRRAMVDAHDAGQSLSAIGRAAGVSRQYVAQIVERRGGS